MQKIQLIFLQFQNLFEDLQIPFKSLSHLGNQNKKNAAILRMVSKASQKNFTDIFVLPGFNDQCEPKIVF